MSDQIIAIDLGSRSTKAVCLDRDGEALRLVSYTIQDRPDFGKVLSRESLSKHLVAVTEALNPKTKQVILVVGTGESLICHAEMPVIGTSEMRKMVKLSPKLYFQEDLPNYSFDCFVLHQEATVKSESKQIRKAKTLIVGIKNQLLKYLQSASNSAGLDVEQVTASQTGAANCFVLSPEGSQNKIVALVDIGFSHSTISLLVNGEITLTRVVNIGADQFTAGLAEAMGITYSVAEGLKQIMPEKVNAQLKTLILPLSNELSNSIHFFEQQQDKKVSDVYVSGGSARSKFIIEILQSDLHLPCKSWDPTSSLKVKFTAAQSVALQQEAPQLTVAIGAAQTWFKPHLASIDLLAEQREAAEMRNRDPMKRGYAIAGLVFSLLLVWYVALVFNENRAGKKVEKQTAELNGLQQKFTNADLKVAEATQIENIIGALNQYTANRFLQAPALNALQYTVVDNFQIVRLQIYHQFLESMSIPAFTNSNKVAIPGRPAESLDQTVFTIQAKSVSKPSAAENFMDTLAESSWFKANLRSKDPIRLKESQAPQIEGAKTTIFFTVECYAERKL